LGEAFFTGFHYHKVDAKGKVMLPKEYRDGLGDKVAVQMDSAIYPGAGGKFVFLKVMPVAQWKKMSDKRGKLTRNQKRLLLGVDITEVDKVGRIQLPHSMRKMANTEEGMEICVAGNDDVVEIWNRDRYEEAMIAGLYDEMTQSGMEQQQERGTGEDS
jgi:division/cell wall cluster transcriptional repressor MraZ